MLDARALSNYFARHTDIHDLDNAALALIYLGTFELNNDDFTAVGALERCKELLKGNPDFHELLKKAHERKELGPVQTSGE